MSERFEKVGSLGQLVCGFSIPVWLWRIACFTTDFHSFLTGNWHFAVNVGKCCSKLYLIKISCRSIRNPEKGLSSLFIKSYNLDKKLSEFRLHSFPKNKVFFYRFLKWWDECQAYFQVGSGWNFKSLNIFHHKMLKFT